MQVRLTKLGYKLCRSLVALDGAMLNEIEQDVTWDKSGGGVTIDASYAAWKHLYGLVYRRTIGPRGGKKSETQFTTLRRITRELNYFDFHPAMFGVGMLNWQPDVFPVWKIDPDETGKVYSPYPMPGHQFVILVPQWDRIKGEPKVTRWLEKDSAPGRLSREETHLILQRHPVLR